MDLPDGLLELYSESRGRYKSEQKPTALNGSKINYLPVPTGFEGVFGKNVLIQQKLGYLPNTKLVNLFIRPTTLFSNNYTQICEYKSAPAL